MTPPILEEEDFNRQSTDSEKFRRRIGFLPHGHERVAPYAYQLGVVLYQKKDINNFIRLCKIAELRLPVRVEIDTSKRYFCSRKRLFGIQKWLKELEWRVAFQVEAILRNGLLNTEDLFINLQQPIKELCKEHRAVASEVLRFFAQALQPLSPSETPIQCFERIRSEKLSAFQPRLPPGMFDCHHVCFTPTRMILEGPLAIQSNRVIRNWVGYQDNFIRVDFRDEDRLQYRWDREVDGRTFLEERVGGILKNGFELAGRKFEFLAYSTSSLR